MSISILSTIVGAVLARTDKSPVIIAIDGPSASGKTSFANSIERDFDCNVFRMDDFFLTPERKTPERLATPGGNVDWEGFKENVMENIKLGNMKDGKQKYFIDTMGINYKEMLSLGLKKEHICLSSICTKCNKDWMYSYRGDPIENGRNIAFICLKGD